MDFLAEKSNEKSSITIRRETGTRWAADIQLVEPVRVGQAGAFIVARCKKPTVRRLDLVSQQLPMILTSLRRKAPLPSEFF
jgi:hypothetical protein